MHNYVHLRATFNEQCSPAPPCFDGVISQVRDEFLHHPQREHARCYHMGVKPGVIINKINHAHSMGKLSH